MDAPREEDTAPPAPARPAKKRCRSPPSPKITEQQLHANVRLRTGSQLTLQVRQQFESRAEAKEFIQDFALAQGKRARLDAEKSGGKNFTFVCNSTTPCDFVVRVCKSGGSQDPFFYVSSFQADHGPECTGTEAVTTRQVVNHLLNARPLVPKLSGTSVRAIVESQDGIKVPARMAHRAKQAVTGNILEGVISGTQKLKSLLTQFQALNPTVMVSMDVDSESNEFKRAFLMLPHATLLQRHGMQVLGFDGFDMAPSSNYDGVFLELVAKDGNNESATLAVALCDGRTEENYTWFLQACVDGGLSLETPMLCDRTSALVSATKSLSCASILPIQCIEHLVTTMEGEFKTTFSQEVRQLIHRARDADTKNEFEAAMYLLDVADARVAAYLWEKDPETWAKHCFLKRHPLFGWQTTTLEAENPAVSLVRMLPPFDFFQCYMERSMSALYSHKSESRMWVGSGRVLTSYAEGFLQQHELEASDYTVSPSDDDTGTAYVSDSTSLPAKKRRVRLSAKSCSCPFPDQVGLPCRHLCAAAAFFNERGGKWDLAQLCHPVYTVANYAQVYGPQTAAVQLPVDEELERDEAIQVVKPPNMKRCSLCHELGHNKRKCTSPPQV